MKTPIFICTLILIFLHSCKGQQYTLDNLPEKQIIFGNGGGITGEVKTYTLLENGQIFYHSSLVNVNKELENISKKEAKNIYEKMSNLQLSVFDFNHPGNRYYFIEEVNGSETNRVTWGSLDHKVSDDCEALYKELTMTLK